MKDEPADLTFSIISGEFLIIVLNALMAVSLLRSIAPGARSANFVATPRVAPLACSNLEGAFSVIQLPIECAWPRLKDNQSSSPFAIVEDVRELPS